MVMDNSIHTDEQTDNAINNSTFEEESEVGKVVSNWTGLDMLLYNKKHRFRSSIISLQ